MKIYISSDHAGFDLKTHLITFFKDKNFDVADKGPFEKNPDDDYPDLIALVAEEVSQNPLEALGIVIGLSGQGEAMAANKFQNVRAGVYYGGPKEIVELMREHNNANVLSLGAKFLSKEEAEMAVALWLETKFSNDPRHVRRIEKMNDLGKYL